MLAKLPDWLITRWGRKVSDWKDNGKGFPPFKEFIQFMIRESNIACDPVVSLQALKSSSIGEKSKAGVGKNERVKQTGSTAFSTKVVGENSDKGEKSKSKSFKVKCFLCSQAHHIDDCPLFLKWSLGERKTFIKEKRLCYGCIKPGHIAQACRNRIVCKTCSKKHPTSLHGDIVSNNDVPKTDQRSNSDKSKTDNVASVSGNVRVTHLNGTKEISKSSLIVPVWLSHCDSPENEILTYALLDTQSDTTFVLDEVSEELGLVGTETKLLLSTMVSKNQTIDTKRFQGLTIRGFNSQMKIQLPVTFSRAMIPANRSHIPTPEMASQWSHLQHIASELLPLQDCEIGLLIGYNCPKALLPREVIPPIDDGPFGQKTDIGWGYVAPILV
ncbi:hypothetical protein HOLleu_44344 [Holothuria leucospilota]|uniref:CCHC-type domain-containing protein n=1 Tax=Holothuria leucospilota TaxID=206669 RepID=A0A9Q0YDE5_HOLLE|nr:hypothetical protein HOLleu_44344 [Holothuria leucospilota]